MDTIRSCFLHEPIGIVSLLNLPTFKYADEESRQWSRPSVGKKEHTLHTSDKNLSNVFFCLCFPYKNENTNWEKKNWIVIYWVQITCAFILRFTYALTVLSIPSYLWILNINRNVNGRENICNRHRWQSLDRHRP